MQKILYCIVILTLLSLSYGGQCGGKPGPVHYNQSPIIQGIPRLVKTVPNGKLYQVGSSQLNNVINLIHVYGNMYQMGYAQGMLLKNELKDFLNSLWEYMQSEFTDILPKWVPKKLQLPLAGKGLAAALDLTYYATRFYTNKKYYQQLKGLADAAQVDFKLVRRIHMIGQLTKGTCSMYGAWGKATLNGKTMQLRALDWDFDGPYWKVPLLTVYHPNSKKLGNHWMNIGFFGWVGVISGINQHKLAVSQIGVYFNDQSWGKTSRIGDPFTFVLRDILQFDTTLDQSIHRLNTTRRTCDLLLGVGDGKLKTDSFRGFQYSYSVCNVFGDKNLQPNSEYHPRIENTVYWAMDWNCPYFHQRFAEQLNQFHGYISPQTTIRYILPAIGSGNLQAVVYDLTDMQVYIAYGFVDQKNKKINAYDRPFIKLKMQPLFNEQQK